jgi:[histone H3]-lysine4 N-trimethyltransferase SETD1
MQLIGDKDLIKATKSLASPPRQRKIPPKKTVEEEVADAILAELKEVFMRDVRSRIVNPMILDCLDPSHYRDIQPKKEMEAPKVVQPEVKISPVKEESVTKIPLQRLSMTNRIPLLPRFRKKGVEPVKGDSTVADRKPTKADVRPMHHQFNHYSDSEDEDELPQREATVASDDEDESSRPSRETTTLSTPEPSRIRNKSLAKVKDVTKVVESELLKDILDATKNEAPPSVTKRKRIIDFTSSEDEDEPTPAKKVCVEPDVIEVTDAMELDEPITPKLSKAAIMKAAKAKAAALRRAKKAETKVKVADDSISVETIPVEKVKPQLPPKPKIPEVSLTKIEDDSDILLDLDGIQSLIRDKEDYRALVEVLDSDTLEPIHDIWTWSWKQKRLKALNFDGAEGKCQPHYSDS